MVSKGLMSVHTYAAKIWNYEEDPNLYRALDRSGELPLRVLVNLDELFEPEEKPKPIFYVRICTKILPIERKTR